MSALSYNTEGQSAKLLIYSTVAFTGYAPAVPRTIWQRARMIRGRSALSSSEEAMRSQPSESSAKYFSIMALYSYSYS